MQEKYPLFEELVKHLRRNIERWPASKGDIMSACSDTSQVGGDERAVCEDMLPDKLYRSPDDVMRTLREMSP